MNQSFLKIFNAPLQEQKGLFLATATRLGVPLQNIEKDFWICWVLDLLFNNLQPDEPRLLFKGGTSLSKAHSLISRFSEDIDITVFRQDIEQSIPLEELESLSGKQQRKHLDNIKLACKQYIQTTLKSNLENKIKSAFTSIGRTQNLPAVVIDPEDNSGQTLLIQYPSVDKQASSYVDPTIKIECGAKSALDPHRSITIKPYIAEEIVSTNFDVTNITTIEAERTFWDKIIILHGIRRWYELKGELRQDGQRYSPEGSPHKIALC